jgi:hypothetical protein
VTAQPSPDAIRARLYRERRAAAPIPPDVQILLDRGRLDRLDLLRYANAVHALSRVEASAALKLLHIQRVKQPAIRARLLGELADWLVDRLATMDKDFGSENVRSARVKMRRVPSWVPENLIGEYLKPEFTEFEAASRVRQMKREASGVRE